MTEDRLWKSWSVAANSQKMFICYGYAGFGQRCMLQRFHARYEYRTKTRAGG